MPRTFPVQFLMGCVCFLPGVDAQDVVRLWEGQPKPYSKDNRLIEREQSAWGALCVANVTEPTLTIFSTNAEKNTGVGVVIIPGGNYSVVAIHHEGYDVAKLLAEQGITAAVLKYRLPDPKSSDRPERVPLADTRRALKLLRQQSVKYGIDKNQVGVVGFSAGSHLATVTSLWKMRIRKRTRLSPASSTA